MHLEFALCVFKFTIRSGYPMILLLLERDYEILSPFCRWGIEAGGRLKVHDHWGSVSMNLYFLNLAVPLQLFLFSFSGLAQTV